MIEDSIEAGARRANTYSAIQFAWNIGKKAKSVKAYREALRLILWKISESSKPGGEPFDFDKLNKELPVIPDDILEALRALVPQ